MILLATSSSRKLRLKTLILMMPSNGFDSGRKLQQVYLIATFVWSGISWLKLLYSLVCFLNLLVAQIILKAWKIMSFSHKSVLILHCCLRWQGHCDFALTHGRPSLSIWGVVTRQEDCGLVHLFSVLHISYWTRSLQGLD